MKISNVGIPQTAVPVHPLVSTYRYGRSILVDVAHRVLYRRRRDRDQVASDYDGGEWAQQKAARRWESATSLAGYADREWRSDVAIAKMGGRLWRVPMSHYFAFRRQKLISLLSEYDLGQTTLFEIGSGTGSNLFALATVDRWQRLVGLEISATGREVAQQIAARFGVGDRVEFAQIDLLDPQSQGFERIRAGVVFSHYCLEQLPSQTEVVFRNLVAAGIKRAIMIEPSFELLDRTKLSDLASMTYVLRQDYQRSIVRVARKLESEGLIRVVAVRRLDFVSGVRQDPTLLVWDVAGTD